MSKDQLLEAIRARAQKQTEFGYGILTADRYVKTLEDYAGTDACNKLASRGRSSFHDLLTKAAKTLVYSNEDMRLLTKDAITFSKRNGSARKLELPKNTLMSFRHVLTSSREDRDGDILHSEGGVPDPKMLLLWQHVHTMPIGKYLVTTDQNRDKMIVESCIVDVNSLCHDAAVMVDNDMGRFSHGFRALEFTESKAKRGGSSGFDITKFEIMEESLVSVPANVDAQTEEVILGLVEGGKLTSPIMKQVGRGIRNHRNIQVPGVKIKYRERLGDTIKELQVNSLADLQTAAAVGLIGTKAEDHNPEGENDENKPAVGGEAGAGREKSAVPSEEADAEATDNEEEATTDEKVTCPECNWSGVQPEDGKCPECGADLSEEESEEEENKTVEVNGEKSFSGPLPNSFEWVREELQQDLNHYFARLGMPATGHLAILSTFKNYLVVMASPVMYGPEPLGPVAVNATVDPIYYEVDWALVDGEPTLTGDPRQVKLTVDTEYVKRVQMTGMKAGRTVSKTNKEHLAEAMANHEEVLKMEDRHASRAAKALVKEAHGHCKTVHDADEDKTAAVTAKEAMAAFIAKATDEERKQLSGILEVIEKSGHIDPLVTQYKQIKRV